MTAHTTAPAGQPVALDGPEPLVTMAGDGTAGFRGDGLPAATARLAFPADVAVGPAGVLIADHANHRVRRIDPTGVITTVAGDGLRGFGGDGAEAVRARLGFPSALAVGADGGVFVADELNHRVRRIDPTGVITTVAGDGTRGDDGDTGDGGPAARARLDAPCALAMDGSGRLYVGEAGTRRVRGIGTDGVISTVVAASGRPAGAGAADAGDAFLPAGLAVDGAGRLHIADPVGRRVLLLDEDGTLRVLAGPPGGGDGAVAVDWSAPCAVAVDAQGAVYVADMNGHRVWRLTGRTADVVAGAEPTADEAVRPTAGSALAYPRGLAVDPAGRLLVADNFHHRVAALPLTVAPPVEADEEDTGGTPRPDTGADSAPDTGETPQPDTGADSAPDTGGTPRPDTGTDGTQGAPEAVVARLLVRQEVGVEIPRGGGELLHVRVSSTDAWAPGRVEHRFTAPTGLVFDGRATCAYYRVDGSVVAAPEPAAAVREGGRLLSVTDEPRLNTPGNPAAALVYTLGVRARADAEPGRYSDGRAVIAGQPEVRLKASVLGDDED
ncbi:serine/threonine protein kinase [Streptomyces sp. NRRL S-31]|uniref:serine/threonine protein kinase n=1 Tax=Streptomyces sp. NRRL S-31 TaxID=1463898 RepID=UPI000AAD4A97|nr:serine/threonine protein kinase [Streptomyces sp. NRRL S-31]